MRRRGLCGGFAVLLLLVAGCGTAPEPAAAPGVSASAAPTGSAGPSGPGPRPTRWPAAAAGGACQLLDYGVVEEVIGLVFDVAAGGQQEATYTCVLQRIGSSVPDLTLTVTPSNASPAIFRTVVMPKGAAALTGLGKVGYRAALPAVVKAGRGPGIEIGWLSGNNRIIVLRLTLAVEAQPPAADAAAPKLLDLAKRVDQTSV